jgi:hypothetical protein
VILPDVSHVIPRTKSKDDKVEAAAFADKPAAKTLKNAPDPDWPPSVAHTVLVHEV